MSNAPDSFAGISVLGLYLVCLRNLNIWRELCNAPLSRNIA